MILSENLKSSWLNKGCCGNPLVTIGVTISQGGFTAGKAELKHGKRENHHSD
jgi:hypothetical protein